MSEADLPEDLARWPRDAYQLLGVPRDVAPRELRRAYTRLIRTYKPEQYPDHFRRIREAYEFVLFAVGNGARFLDEPSAPPETEEIKLARPSYTFDGALREAWDRACAGDEAGAYGQLRQLHESHPGQEDACLRLYWLLALQPELDAVRVPCDWLVAGLRGSGLSGPLRELYRRELAARPEEALEDRCTSLLTCPGPPALVMDLLAWRWRAAGKLGRLASIVAPDVERLYERLTVDDDDLRLRLLLQALDRLAWSEERAADELVGTYYQRIEQMVHLHQHYQYDLEQLDYLLELAAAWEDAKKDTSVAPEFLELIPLSWSSPLSEYRPLFMNFLEDITLAPRDYLDRFDRIRESYPSLLMQFGRMLGQLSYTVVVPPETRPPEVLANGVFELLDLGASESYPWLRPRLLSYCMWESLSPEWVAQTVAEYPGAPFAREIHEDWSLRYVWLTHHLFWA
jgi:hypothetical protein